MGKSRILITGIGSISSLGYHNDEIYNNFKREKINLKIKSDWKNEKIKPLLFGSPHEVSFEEEIKWRESIPPTRYSQLGLLACKSVIEDANLDLLEEDNEVGLIIETCLAATESVEDYLHDLYLKGVPYARPLKFTKTVANTVLGDISRHFKLNGPSSLLYNENSICYGYDLIKKGIADIVICGGVDHFTEFRVLSEQKNNMLADSVPLRDLLDKQQVEKNILGEGSAFLVLESEESAKARNAKVYTELVDYHSNFDYENVDHNYKRGPHILEDALTHLGERIAPKDPITFMSAYTTQTLTRLSENPALGLLRRTNPLEVVNHKFYTGDMKAASNVMGVCISSQILSRENQNSHYALVSNSHEGGSSSHFLMKQFKSN